MEEVGSYILATRGCVIQGFWPGIYKSSHLGGKGGGGGTRPCCFITIRTYVHNCYTAKKNKTHYGIRVVTARSYHSGSSDPNIFLVLVGENHRPNKIRIQGSLFKRNKLRSGYYNDIAIEIDGDEGLGQVEVVLIEMDPSLSHPQGHYHVDFIEVHSIISDGAKKAHFPFYHWIKPKETMSCVSRTCKCL